MTGTDKRKQQAARQSEHRAKLRKLGYKRLEIHIPPALWRRLRPVIGHYQPGKALVRLLDEIDFGEQQKSPVSFSHPRKQTQTWE